MLCRRRSCIALPALPYLLLAWLCSSPAVAQDTGAATKPALESAASQPVTASAPAPTSADGRKLLTLDAIYGPKERVEFDGEYARGLTWLPDGAHYLERRDGVLMRVDAATGAREPAYDHEALAAALRKQGDFDEAAATRLSRNPGELSEDRALALLEHKDRLYLYRFSDGQLRRLTKEAEPREVVALSPRGGFAYFVRENNLYSLDTHSGRQRRLTRDGDEKRLNAKLDWVYQEEVYGRGTWQAHWPRSDDAYVAYLQLDESRVPVFTITDPTQTPEVVMRCPYPKAGDPNPTARLGVVKPTGGSTKWIDLSQYKDQEVLIVRVAWAPDGRLLYQVQDRVQRWLDLNEADPATGKSRTVLHEVSPAWLEPIDQPHWLADGTFLWLSERDGWRHIYHHARDGRLIQRLTSGDWDARELLGVDERSGWAYFSGTRDSTIEMHIYRVRLGGGPVERLTEPGASHSASCASQTGMLIDTFSNATTPPKVHLRGADGRLLRVISENDRTVLLAEYALSAPRFVRVPARDGCLLNGLLIMPTDFNPGRQYPVWSFVYGGPAAPMVTNRWSREGMFRQMLAQQGYIVWICDPRIAVENGAVTAWQARGRLGEQELADLEDGARWLISQGNADPGRIGIEGYSYGGFLTCYAMTHSELFAAGVAGGSVTDWRLYDSIYTERLMGLPSQNKAGYDAAAPLKEAAKLHGRLLLVHGAVDDNVHFQNSLEMMLALQKAGKVFNVMVYPRDEHSLHIGRRHFAEQRLDFMRSWLRL